MPRKPKNPHSKAASPTAQELKGDIDRGRTGDKVSSFDPGAAPLGTDDEAAGRRDTPPRVQEALRQELETGRIARLERPDRSAVGPFVLAAERGRPVSPNIQIYRPQLTSVLSIANRITGVILSIGAVGLVAWLVAGDSGPRTYAVARDLVSSLPGQIVLFAFTFAFFLHLCGGIRHLVWDTVHGFELRQIYFSGWVSVAASILLTLAAWMLSMIIGS